MKDKNKLKRIILDSLESVNDLGNILKLIDKSTLIVGTGGSKVVGEFLSSILETKNKVLTKVVDVRDLLHIDISKYDNIFITSFSGSNWGVKVALSLNKKSYLLSKRKTKTANETLIHYDITKEESFISLLATIVPMSILLSYYLGEKFAIILEGIFKSLDESITLEVKETGLNIFVDASLNASTTFLESTLIESGLNIPIIHEKYSYCHGRSTINKNHKKSSIYLNYIESDLDNSLIDVINNSCYSNITVKRLFKDSIVNDFYTCLQCMYLLDNMAKENKIDLRKIKYDKESVRKLYYFKGSM